MAIVCIATPQSIALGFSCNNQYMVAIVYITMLKSIASGFSCNQQILQQQGTISTNLFLCCRLYDHAQLFVATCPIATNDVSWLLAQLPHKLVCGSRMYCHTQSFVTPCTIAMYNILLQQPQLPHKIFQDGRLYCHA